MICRTLKIPNSSYLISYSDAPQDDGFADQPDIVVKRIPRSGNIKKDKKYAQREVEAMNLKDP